MKFLPEIGLPQTGETVDSGMYACMNCPHDKMRIRQLYSFTKEKSFRNVRNAELHIG